MAMTSGWFGGLTADQADKMESELRQDAEADGLGVSFRRAAEENGLLALGWFVTAPPVAGAADRVAAPPGEAAGIAAAVRDASARVGVDAATLAAFAQVESGLDPAARAGASSARGLFGITDATWGDLVARFGPAHGVSAEHRDRIGAQCLMAAELLRGSAAALLRGLGRTPSPAELYCGHFLGTGAACALLTADRAEPATDPLRRFYAGTRFGEGFADRILLANRPIFERDGRRRSAGEVMDLLGSKMQRGLARAAELLGPQPLQSPPPFPGPASDAAPEWLRLARAEEAAKVAELRGKASNPRIEHYFSWTSLGEQPDGTAWCAAFVSFCLGAAGELRMGDGSARAVNWLAWGKTLSEPRPGCIVVLKPQARGTSGHVGFWVGEAGGRVTLLGGNQGGRVSQQPYPRGEVRPNGLRWPA